MEELLAKEDKILNEMEELLYKIEELEYRLFLKQMELEYIQSNMYIAIEVVD